MDKINVLSIIARHVDTLRDYSTGDRSWPDLGLFFGLPLILAGLGFYLRWGLAMDALNALLAAFAIFAGLLLNLLILVYTFSSDTPHPTALAKVRSTVIRELHDNIAYSVFISLIVVVLCLVAVARLDMSETHSVAVHTGRYLTAAFMYLTTNFVLTLLMILKRIHVMLRNKLDQVPMRKAS